MIPGVVTTTTESLSHKIYTISNWFSIKKIISMC